jgi:hypothetical protein
VSNHRERLALWGGTALLIGCASMVAKVALDRIDKAKPVSVQTSERVRTGTEVVAVFLTSAACPASRAEQLPAAVREIGDRLRQQAQSEGKTFAMVGVAADHSPDTGIEFLARFGGFDEILAGGSWLNTGSISYLIRPGEELTTPQLLVFERDIQAGKVTLTVGAERFLLRKVGVDRILEYQSELSPGR